MQQRPQPLNNPCRFRLTWTTRRSAGDEIEFNTVVTNNGTQASPAFHVAMNIIKMGSGDPVDPEDWSPERTQEVDSLAPGESVEQAWVVWRFWKATIWSI